MLDVHALDRSDAVGEVEDLRLGEGRQREEALLEVAAASGTDLADAVVELVALGASPVDAVLAEGDSAAVADPAGTETCVLPPP